MQGVSKFLWLLAIFGALGGTYFLSIAMSLAESAPQEAAAGALAAASAVVPYVFARAFDEITRSRS